MSRAVIYEKFGGPEVLELVHDGLVHNVASDAQKSVLPGIAKRTLAPKDAARRYSNMLF